jgi:hypothetical protein
MDHSGDYHAQADHARRLADITVQRNIAEILRRVAAEFDHLAEEIAAGEADLRNPTEGGTLVSPVALPPYRKLHRR